MLIRNYLGKCLFHILYMGLMLKRAYQVLFEEGCFEAVYYYCCIKLPILTCSLKIYLLVPYPVLDIQSQM